MYFTKAKLFLFVYILTLTFYSSAMEIVNFSTDIEKVQEEDICSICFEGIEDILFGIPGSCPVGTKKCTKKYHSGCLNRWVSIQQMCPFCRGKVVENNMYVGNKAYKVLLVTIIATAIYYNVFIKHGVSSCQLLVDRIVTYKNYLAECSFEQLAGLVNYLHNHGFFSNIPALYLEKLYALGLLKKEEVLMVPGIQGMLEQFLSLLVNKTRSIFDCINMVNVKNSSW